MAVPIDNRVPEVYPQLVYPELTMDADELLVSADLDQDILIRDLLNNVQLMY